MSDHDALMSALIAVRNHLETYVEEYDPPGGTSAIEYMAHLLVTASKFPDDEQLQ